MILHDPRGAPATTRIGGRATLDGMLRQAARRRPDEVALLDPPNRESFTDGRPRDLTYAQADRMVSAIAATAGPGWVGAARRGDTRIFG